MNAVFVVFACLATGEDCRPHVVSNVMPMFECLSGPTAQVELLKWLQVHPKHRYQKHACVDPKRLDAYLGKHAA